MLTAIIFLIVLAVLIFVHELGHFLAARAAGIRVDAFKIGFGPRIIHWKRGETEYGINLIPFGGYVKIHGENPDEEAVSGTDATRSFINKPRWKQVMVLVAGVAFNFLFALILYTSAFISGVTASSDSFQKYADKFTNVRVMVAMVAPGSPAEKAGLSVGDTISVVSINKADGMVPRGDSPIDVPSIQQLIRENGGQKLILEVDRKGVLKNFEITPVQGLISDATSTYAIGIAMQQVGNLHLSFLDSVGEGFKYTLVMIRETTVGLYTFIINIFRGTANFSDVAGPVGIAGVVGNAAELGFTYLLMITALISINLGVINLIPFPALDGGRTLFVLIEGLIRRRISMKFTNTVNAVGFVLLMILMIVVTYKDIAKLFK